MHKYSSWIHVTDGFYCTRGTFKLPVLELGHNRKAFNYFYFYCQCLTIAMIILCLLSKITISFSHQIPATRISSTRTHCKRHFYFSASLFWSWAMKQSNILQKESDIFCDYCTSRFCTAGEAIAFHSKTPWPSLVLQGAWKPHGITKNSIKYTSSYLSGFLKQQGK